MTSLVLSIWARYYLGKSYKLLPDCVCAYADCCFFFFFFIFLGKEHPRRFQGINIRHHLACINLSELQIRRDNRDNVEMIFPYFFHGNV